MEAWTGAQRAFAVKAFYKNGDIFVIAQREFRTGKKSGRKLCLHCHVHVAHE